MERQWNGVLYSTIALRMAVSMILQAVVEKREMLCLRGGMGIHTPKEDGKIADKTRMEQQL